MKLRNFSLPRVWALGATLSVSVCLSPTQPVSASNASSPSASPSPIESTTQPKTQDSLVGKAEAKVLLKEFLRAQATELKAIRHRNQFELKEFVLAQEARFNEWKAEEKSARVRFFEQHTSGADQREYIKSYRERLEARRKDMALEKSRKAADLEARVKLTKDDQSKNLEQVKKLLDAGKRPDRSLWPKMGL